MTAVMAAGQTGAWWGARLGEPGWLHALWVVPVMVLVLVIAARARRRAMSQLATPGLQMLIGARARGRGVWNGLVVAAVGLVVLALARPQWNPRPREVTRQGRDVVFVVDVSRSMLARDLAPSRLERAKLWIKDLTGTLEGDRVGLVAFAGAAVVKCPLTLDHGFFSLSLDELTPESVPVGGTNIGDAIRKVLSDVFGEVDAGDVAHRDIILITDGDDQESLPVDAASVAGREGVRIIALGLGSDEQGATIPVEGGGGREGSLTYRGEAVRSRQDSGQLARIAGASAGGVYLNVGTGTIDLDRVYKDLVRSAQQGETSQAVAVKHDEGFQFLLAPAVALLLVEGLRRDRSR